MLDQQLGSYRIVKKLGEGGMGVVYLGEHVSIGRKAAIKVLLPQFSAHPEVLQRFFNEARTAGLIRHPGLVDVLDFGQIANGSAFLVMEFLDGESLGARLVRERLLASDLALAITRQVASAVAAAHQRGIIHRDLKPDNLFLTPDSELPFGLRVKVLDFGIAKLTGDAQPGLQTRTSAIMGTPVYMSPEQCRGAGHVDARSDLYSLGCILFEMVCGRPPFVGEGAGDLMGAHLRDAPPDPLTLRRDLPPVVAQLILGLLAKDPNARQPSSMTGLITALEAAGARSTGGRLSPVDATLVPSSPSLRPLTPTAPPSSPGPVTTLSGSASQLDSAAGSSSARRRGLVVAVVGLLVAGGAAALYQRSRHEPPALPAAVAGPRLTVEPADERDLGPRPELAPLPPAPPPPRHSEPVVKHAAHPSRPTAAPAAKPAMAPAARPAAATAPAPAPPPPAAAQPERKVHVDDPFNN